MNFVYNFAGAAVASVAGIFLTNKFHVKGKEFAQGFTSPVVEKLALIALGIGAGPVIQIAADCVGIKDQVRPYLIAASTLVSIEFAASIGDKRAKWMAIAIGIEYAVINSYIFGPKAAPTTGFLGGLLVHAMQYKPPEFQ